MMKQFLIAIGWFISCAAMGQNANVPAATTIKANFTIASIKAYQESATLKVADYYQYLGLLSSSNTSDALKTEVKAALFALFEDKNVTVADITATTPTTIALEDLITKITNQNYSFTLSNYENSIVAADYWTTKYQVTIQQNETQTEQICFQRVLFKPTTKTFGTTKKEIWTLFLGEVTF